MKKFTKISLMIAAVTGGIGIFAIVLGLVMGADLHGLTIGISSSPHQKIAVSRVMKEIAEEGMDRDIEEIVEEIVEDTIEESSYVVRDIGFGEDKNAMIHKDTPRDVTDAEKKRASESAENTQNNYLLKDVIDEEKKQETEVIKETQNNNLPRETSEADVHNAFHNKDVPDDWNQNGNSRQLQGINRLEIEAKNVEVSILSVDNTQGISYVSNRGNHIARVEGSTLKIEDDRTLDTKMELQIYLPIGILKELDLEAVNGTLTADKITADHISIEIDNASVQIGQLLVTKKADLQIHTGEMTVDYFQGGNLETECAVGSILITCEGKQSDYDYELECDMGEIRIQDETYSGIGEEYRIHNQASKTIKAECDIGNIMLKFAGNL